MSDAVGHGAGESQASGVDRLNGALRGTRGAVARYGASIRFPFVPCQTPRMPPSMTTERVLFTLAASIATAVGLLSMAGCQPSYQAAEDAGPLPLAARDARETGETLDVWPAWRGQDASGVAPGGSPPVDFSPERGVRWKTAVPGSGNSSPVVWRDRIFLTTAIGDERQP
ncbi:MAG: hypothetical protein U1E05_07740, partial [Patescibacteria group bacterium]|nr:hypothetical protein [Patescibacteria group bacterium]